MNVLDQFITSGIVSLIIGLLTIWGSTLKHRAEVKAAQAARDATVAVTELDNAHEKDSWKHEDWKTQQAELLSCEKRCAVLEAKHDVTVSLLADALKRVRDLEEANDRLNQEVASLVEDRNNIDHKLRDALQRLAYVDFFDTQGKFHPEAIKTFAERLIKERNADERRITEGKTSDGINDGIEGDQNGEGH